MKIKICICRFGCLWPSSKDKYVSDNYTLKEILVLREDIEKVLNRIESPSVFGFSCYVWNEEYQLELSRQVKKKFSNCLIIFGGPQVPDEPKQYLDNYSHIDVCIRGEGEEPFKQILLGNELHTIKGIHTKSVQLGHSERIEDLDDIPSPYTNGIFDNLIEKHTDIDWCYVESNKDVHLDVPLDWGRLTFSK